MDLKLAIRPTFIFPTKVIPMSSARIREDKNPWYKEPWPWILMSGPAIVVVACIYTIYLAYSHFDQPLSGATKRGLQVIPNSAEYIQAPKVEVPKPQN